MAALRYIGAVGVALFAVSAAHGEAVSHWQPYITQASARFGIPETWITRVMLAESGGHIMRNGRPIRSKAGAMGLMQLMPGTWEEMRRDHRLGDDPDDPSDNILAGTAYLRQLYDRFGYPGMFAAYNAGPSRYARYLSTGRALPMETVAYLRSVSGTHLDVKQVAKLPLERLFVVRHEGENTSATMPAEPPVAGGIFAIRTVLP